MWFMHASLTFECEPTYLHVYISLLQIIVYAYSEVMWYMHASLTSECEPTYHVIGS